MHNQHAGLSQELAAQRITERQEQAARARLAHCAGRSRRRRRRWLARRWWQLARRPGAAAQPGRPAPTPSPLIDGIPMSKFTRTLAVGATLAAFSLAGMAAAHAQATDQATLRPPTERQVGESWRHRQAAAKEQTAADAALGRMLARERFSVPDATPAQVPDPAPTQPNQQPSWLPTSLGVLAVLMLLAGLAARRVRRRTPPPAASPTR
jgi:hypothetical protein